MRLSHWITWALSLGMLAFANLAAAQDSGEPEDPGTYVHYAYSALFGTGWYKLNDRKVFVLNAPFSFELRPTTEEKPGLRLLMPVSLGLHKFDLDDIDELLSDENVGTMTFVPGLRWEYQINDNWAVRPAAYTGFGLNFTDNEQALIYGGGVRTTYALDPISSRHMLGGELLLAGFTPSEGQSDLMLRLGSGLDLVFPTSWTIGTGTVFLNPQFLGYLYLREVEFDTVGEKDIEVSWELQAGLAVGIDPPLRIFGIKAERVGLAVREGNRTRGIAFVFSFPF